MKTPGHVAKAVDTELLRRSLNHPCARKLRTKTLLGYKLLYRVGDMLRSKADSRQTFPGAKVGTVLDMPGNGIYLSPNRAYVMTYYTDGPDAEYDTPDMHEVLLTLEFDPRDIVTGNLQDRESEVSVRRAKIVKIEQMN